MENDLTVKGFNKLTNALTEMIYCEDRQQLIKLSTNFLNDVGDFIAMLYVENRIEQKDIDNFNKEIDNIENEAVELNDGEVVTENSSTTSVEEEPKPPVEQPEE